MTMVVFPEMRQEHRDNDNKEECKGFQEVMLMMRTVSPC